jgi:hypothetical protein
MEPDATDPSVNTTVDVRVNISSEGVVRRMTIRMVQRDDARTRQLNSTLSFTDIGATSVQEPDWVATARNRTGPTR